MQYDGASLTILLAIRTLCALAGHKGCPPTLLSELSLHLGIESDYTLANEFFVPSKSCP